MSADADDIGEVANPVGKEVGPDDAEDTPTSERAAATIGRRERKPLNKALFAKAAAAAKAHVEDVEEPADDLIETGKPAVDPAKPGDPPAADPPKPAAGPSAEAIAAWERVNVRASELDKREEALRAREAKAGDFAAQFASKPLATLKAMVRADLGDDATEDEVAEEVSFQLTSLSLEHAGATIDPSNQAHDLRKIKRELRLTKAEKRKAAAADVQKNEATTRADQERRAIASIGEEFKAISSKYPFLAADDDAPGLMFAVAKEWHRRHGEVPELQILAERADAQLREEATAKYKRYQHLLQPAQAPAPAAAVVPQGDQPNRRSRTLSNADASEDTSTPDAPARAMSAEERRSRTFKKWAPKLKEAERD